MITLRTTALAALALASCSLAVAQPNTAGAQECVPHRQVSSEVILVDGMVRTIVHTSGYCNPWEAMMDGLAATINNPAWKREIGIARLKAAMELSKQWNADARANELLVTSIMTFRRDPNCPVGTTVPQGCPSPMGTLKFATPIEPVALADKK